MHVKRVISNNAVLAVDDEGKEIVALGRGLDMPTGPARR